MRRRQVDAAELDPRKARGQPGEVEALAEADLEHLERRLRWPRGGNALELPVEALRPEPARAEREVHRALARVVLAIGGRAFLVIGDHFAGAHAFGANPVDAEDAVELVEPAAEVVCFGQGA